ncbi:MAG TPA: transketolase [Acidimicrobiia bacterium]|nr:transketolase [Acidimicrobiia bacterium]
MTTTTSRPETRELADLARLLRRDSIIATTAAGSGHPTSAMSAADVTAALLGRHFRFDAANPFRADNDRFVLSKGHAAPLLYAAMAAFGLIDRGLIPTLREAGSQLEGHPVPGLPLVDVATGSLGQGLSNGLGMALGQRIRRFSSRTWVVLGDSEMAEGSVWEAVELAGHLQVDNLVAIVDLNRLGQRGPTMHEWDASPHIDRAESLGWTAVEFDGHDLDAVDAALAAAQEAEVPSLLVARTQKGKGVSFAADEPNRHGKPFDDEEKARALSELGEPERTDWQFPAAPDGEVPDDVPPTKEWERPTFDEETSTRDAFGAALAARASVDSRLVVIDAEVADSTRAKAAGDVLDDRFIQSYIAEQNMVGMAVGLQAIGLHPLAATFGAFFSRAHDFIRMAQIGRARLTLVGSHAGVSIGEDGPSQMALDDIAMMRAAEGLVLYPADGNATVALLDAALDFDGISYLRTTRGATPSLYPPSTAFPVGGSHLHRAGDEDRVTIAAAGVTLFEALDAAERLAQKGIGARVLDMYSVSPLDVDAVRRCLDETGAILSVEDHRRPGGIGEAIAAEAAAHGSGRHRILAVEGIPGSAEPAEQRRQAGIDAESIVQAATELAEPA